MAAQTRFALAPTARCSPALAPARRPRKLIWLDAASDELLHALDRPPSGLSARRLVKTLAEMMGLETQTMLVRGSVDNATPDALDALGDALRFIFPRRAYLGTISRRPAAESGDPGLTPLAPLDLELAAARIRRRAPGVDVRVY